MRTLFVFAVHVTNRPCKPRHIAKSCSGSSLYAFPALGRTYAPGSSFWAFSTNGRTYSQKQPQEAYFYNFRPLAAQVAKSSSRKLLTSNTAQEICVKLNTTWEIVLKFNTTWKIELAPKKQWGWNKQHPATQQHWPHVWPKVAPGNSFWAFSTNGCTYS